MDPIRSIIDNVTPQMSPDFAWAIIVLLAGILVWALVRYINRLDTILERLDTAIEKLGNNQALMSKEQEDHEKRITKLEDANKLKRR